MGEDNYGGGPQGLGGLNYLCLHGISLVFTTLQCSMLNAKLELHVSLPPS